MARRRDYSSQAKTIAASTTTTVTSSDVPCDKIIAYHIGWTGNTRLDHLTRLRVKANGIPIYDLGQAALRAFIRRFSKSNYPTPLTMIPNSNTIGTASASTTSQAGVSTKRLTIPFLLLDGETQAEQDQTQFPPRSQVTIEFQWGSSASAGNLFVGWTETSEAARFYPKLYGSQMNIAASVANGRYNIQDDGFIRAIGINSVGLERLRATIDGMQLLNGQGISVGGTATGDILSEMEQLDNGFTELSDALTTTPSAASVNLVSATSSTPSS